MYQALYRKFRPQTFSDICGQDHIRATLKNQVADGHLSHAYLFTGSRGTGKTSSAKILAKAVNCLQPNGGDPCNECEICKGIDSGSILDVSEIDAASNNGVDSIRDLRDKISYLPSACKYRVYIIDEVHMLSAGAFNALLKTLEEPPEHAIFILATTEVHKLPATIISRCQRFDFLRISTGEISARLLYVSKQEEILLEQEAADLIARIADGGMRDALSLLDLCAASGETVTEAKVTESAGITGKDHLFQLVGAIGTQDVGQALGILNRLHAGSRDMERLCFDLMAHMRNILVMKTSKSPGELIVATSEELETLKKQAEQFPIESVLHAEEALGISLGSMKQGADKRILLETAVIRLCMPALATTPAALLDRIARLEEAARTGAVTAPKKVKAQTPVLIEAEKAEAPMLENPVNDAPVLEEPEPVPEAAEEPPIQEIEAGAETKLSQWIEILSKLKSSSPLLYAVLDGSLAYINNGFLLIDAPNSQFRDLIKGNPRYREAIRTAALAVTGREYKLGPYKKKAERVKTPVSDPLEDLVHKFGGSLIEVE